MEEPETPQDLMKTNFKVTQISIMDLKKFKKYCKDECGNIYAVGITQLLTMKDRYESLIPIFSRIQEDYDEIKKRLETLETTPTKSKVKTFGE